MAIRDALHRYDLSVSLLITGGAADGSHHHYNDVTTIGPECTRIQHGKIHQRH
jgi:hypothetical protein